MGIFRFGPTNSVVNSSNGGVAFSNGVTGANSLIIDQGGFLITTGVGSVAADLNPFGAWTVTINGTALSTNGSALILRSLGSDFSPTAPRHLKSPSAEKAAFRAVSAAHPWC